MIVILSLTYEHSLKTTAKLDHNVCLIISDQKQKEFSRTLQFVKSTKVGACLFVCALSSVVK